MEDGAAAWDTVLEEVRMPAQARSAVLAQLAAGSVPGSLGTVLPMTVPAGAGAAFARLLDAAPCLFTQIDATVTARGVVHLCEVTLGTRIDSANVYQAFLVQHPKQKPPYLYPPVRAGASGGTIMEALCSEVLSNHGVPHMVAGANGWPVWESKSHVSLNEGRLKVLKLYGDLLIPAAPHNLLVSVKSEVARERLVVSGNRLESVGFGFFKHPSEFWGPARISMLKRWGFVAVYMPSATLEKVKAKLAEKKREATNVNGRPLYRPLDEFGPDMARVAGRVTFLL